MGPRCSTIIMSILERQISRLRNMNSFVYNLISELFQGTVGKKVMDFFGDVNFMCRGSLFQKKIPFSPTKAKAREDVDSWISRIIEVHEHEATTNKQKLQRNINVYPMLDNSTMYKNNYKMARVVFH